MTLNDLERWSIYRNYILPLLIYRTYDSDHSLYLCARLDAFDMLDIRHVLMYSTHIECRDQGNLRSLALSFSQDHRENTTTLRRYCHTRTIVVQLRQQFRSHLLTGSAHYEDQTFIAYSSRSRPEAFEHRSCFCLEKAATCITPLSGWAVGISL